MNEEKNDDLVVQCDEANEKPVEENDMKWTATRGGLQRPTLTQPKKEDI